MIVAEIHPLPMKFWLAAGSSHGPDDKPEQDRAQPDLAPRSLRVLIVEDEFFISLDTAALLRDLGHSVVGIAVSADQAISIADRARPDVVLMDIRLSGERDGIDAAEEIRSRFGIRSIFVTANTDAHTRQRAQAVHALGFLEKPLTKERLRVGLGQHGPRH